MRYTKPYGILREGEAGKRTVADDPILQKPLAESRDSDEKTRQIVDFFSVEM